LIELVTTDVPATPLAENIVPLVQAVLVPVAMVFVFAETRPELGESLNVAAATSFA
jgi:hypothetical protein